MLGKANAMAEFNLGLPYVPVGNRTAMQVSRLGFGFGGWGCCVGFTVWFLGLGGRSLVIGVWLLRLRVWSLRFRAWCLVFGGEGLVVRVMAEFNLGLPYVPVGNRTAMQVWRFGFGFSGWGCCVGFTVWF